MSYNKCIATLGTTLKERGFEDHKEIAAGMCNMWADENGVERAFGRTISNEPKRRRFALTIEEGG